MNFLNDHQHLRTFKTELRIFHSVLKLAGSIDYICIKPNGHFIIIDWKRSKKINTTPFMEKCSKFPGLTSLPDCNYYHYSLQLNIYKYILESEYNMIIDEMYIAIFHPNNSNYIKMEVNSMTDEISTIMA